MIAVDPENRPTFEKALSDFRNSVFPDYFYTFLADYVVNLAADDHVPNDPMTNDPIARSFGQADSIISGICRDWDGIIAAMMEEHELIVSHSLQDELTAVNTNIGNFAGEDLSE
jgi:phosphoinositide-3-kinase regulatory subunit 4